MIQVFDPIFVL